MLLRFWGVRGSIPTPGPETVKYGGNTTCLEIRLNNGKIIIIGAGSGIRALGNKLVMEDMKKGPLDIDLFLSHTHWDHIMGFPFFTPIFIPGNKIRVHGPVNIGDEDLEQIVAGQMSYNYFPVKADELAADIEYKVLKEGHFELSGGVKITTKILNHPIIDLGYRIEADDRVLVTVYDHEPFRNLFESNPDDPDYDEIAVREGQKAAEENNRRVLEFIRGADLLVHDAQYTNREYTSSKLGWGHSPMELVVKNGILMGVKRLALFHHDPTRKDVELDALERKIRARVKKIKKTNIDVFFAREGMEIKL
ncbi:MAG: MBL fold metallo-hydrolase [Spirochaetes bacterium]|nr:MAG: MBL fold metallo-hydrolase [Spirochaetota bacterium]